jgi:hypothetical protein
VPASSQAMGAAKLPPAAGSDGSAAPLADPGIPATGSSVLLVFLSGGERALASAPGMSVGLISATQGSYSSAQLLLDIGQGARIASSAYDTPQPATLSLAQHGSAGSIDGWAAAVRRAENAPQLLRPGLLGGSIPAGAAYAGVSGEPQLDAVAAADPRGRVGAVSIRGSAQTLERRIEALRARKRLVVADLAPGPDGLAELRALARARPSRELLIAVERAPEKPADELLWGGVAGLSGGGGRELTSHTTNQRGLIAAVDIAPTILDYLAVTVPADMRGDRIETDGALHGASLRALERRLRVVGGRRLKALGILLAAWALLLLAAVAIPRTEQRQRAASAWALRVGALAVMWVPVAVLIGAALEPSAAVEYATIALACVLLAAVTDTLLPWPRAPLAPALVSILALVLDALAGTQLLMRSLLGPNPILGARFYGYGNELKSGLAVLVLTAIAAALYPSRRSRRNAVVVAVLGALLAAIEGAARLGAGVGGAILVAAGFAVAAVMLLPGGVSRRRVLLVLASPVVALVALALIDLATAHGSGHYTGSILHARSAGDLRDVIARRYGAAWNELKNHAMPFATALALIYAIAAVRLRERLLAPVGRDPAWVAALTGGLTAGVIGMLVEDSGPVLLVVAVFALGCVCAYLWGRPAPRPTPALGPDPARRPTPERRPTPPAGSTPEP